MANDLKVQLSRAPRDDSDIARAIAHILEWNVQIPEGKVHARVENGWVTLDGEVDYAYQKREVERMVNHVRGVAGVRNFITVRPPASPEAVDAAIEQAFKREAEVDARHVKVEVTDHTAKLYGHVHSMREASAAADGAGPRPRPAHCAAQRLVQADLHVGQRGERCQDGLGTGQRQRDQVGEDGGHGQPGDGLRGRLSSVPDQGQRLGCALRDHPRGGTDRDDLAVGESGHGECPSLPDSGPADIPRPASPVPRPSTELAGLMMCGPRPPASMGRCAAEAKQRARQRRR